MKAIKNHSKNANTIKKYNWRYLFNRRLKTSRMNRPYKIIFLVSTLLTLFLFSLDRGPWTFTLSSMAGYIIVGYLYIAGITATLSGIYFILNLLPKLRTGKATK
jgi:hypothetical protein